VSHDGFGPEREPIFLRTLDIDDDLLARLAWEGIYTDTDFRLAVADDDDAGLDDVCDRITQSRIAAALAKARAAADAEARRR
jgi:hypothetical protein